MSLKDRIGEEIKAAMKAKDKIRLETVRGIKKVILEKESEIRAKGREELTEEEELAIVMQLAKQRRDSIDQYEKANRPELAEKEAQELAILEEYLPKQLSEAEVRSVVQEIVAAVGATSPKEMGKVMGPVMAKLKGQADGKLVQSIVKECLGG
ncbi:MAG: GatB/YqeY domain-containing protein [Prochlorothrix sp.]|nr:GatB/YqeY domain-containing protein [Prochlorothrix sp.]